MQDHPTVAFWEAFRVWVRVAIFSFGGPAGQIAVMHRLLVDDRKWVGEERFLHALNYCMLLPGPEAHQLAIYIGWLLHRFWGGLVAGVLFVLPGFISILALSVIYTEYGHVDVVAGLFYGLKPAVVAVVAEAVVRIGKRALRRRVLVGFAVSAFIAIFFLKMPFPVVVGLAALLGFLGDRFMPVRFSLQRVASAAQRTEVIMQNDDRPVARWHWVRILFVGLVVWFTPVALAWLVYGRAHILVTQGLFFSKVAVLSFGGAYAVLAYVAQQAVEVMGWLRPAEMLDGLAMAETTPGPLIQVVQFVGFVGAYRNPSGMPPLVAAVAASAVVTWVTFVPSFVWIYLGAPYIEQLRRNRILTSALTAITAAVVGVIGNLAVWFALHVWFRSISEGSFGPLRVLRVDPWSVDPIAVAISVAAFVALFRFKVGMLAVLTMAGLIGVLVAVLQR